MQNNSRNPYRSSSGGSRNPYASASGSRRPANRPEVRSAPSQQRPSSAQPVSRSRNPYSSASSARPQSAQRRQSPQPRQGGGYHLTSAGKIAVLVLTLVIVFGAVFAVTRFVGGRDRQVAANVPVKPTAAPAIEATAQPEAAAQPEATTDASQLGKAPADATAAPTQQPVQQTNTGLRSATIRSIGDFVIHEPIYKAAKLEDGSYDFTPMLSYIADSMADADYTVANVDGPMGGAGKRGYKGYPQFNTPPHLMKNLKDIGVDMLTLANNHALDTYFDGLKAEIEACISIGMDYVGAARTQEEDDTPVIKEINGIKVGFLNYTHSTNTMEKHSDEDASVYGLDIARFADFEADAQAARDAGAEVLVAYMHWGEEYERNPGSQQQSYGPKLVAAGVDVIIGGHPHMVQPCYWLEGTRTSDGGTQRTLCLSSLGNFLSDQRLQYRDSGIMFDFTIQETAPGEFEIVNPQYIPTYVWRTGSEEAGYDYRVVPCGPYLEDAPDGMDSESHARLVEVWYEIIEHMNTGNATCTVLEK